MGEWESMSEPRVNEKAVAILENMIQHVLARPSMYGRPSDVESTALTLAAVWEQFYAEDPAADVGVCN